MWKETNVSPIFKKDDHSIVSNYKPLVQLVVLEKIVPKHLFNFNRDHNILSALQLGFVPGDSTVNQLIDIYDTFCKSLDEGKEVRAVFDRVWHKQRVVLPQLPQRGNI